MAEPTFNIRDFGAKGDGIAVDSPAINAAIDAAVNGGGGTVVIPAGKYLSYSVRLKSNLALRFEPGATLIAAEKKSETERYDPAEKNDSGPYQDFGHSHWQNSLIWGIGLENVSITGPGLIDGTHGLTRHGPSSRPAKEEPGVEPADIINREMDGLGNKAIGLKNCRNITFRDFSVLNGGHFAFLLTGVDHLTLDNLKVDTNRDGFDIDACRNVRVSNCSVNTPNDDAIVLKSSHGLGFVRATENVTITNCFVSGFDGGSMLDATFKRTQQKSPDRDGPTGRIKFGTESNGGFRNITITNCIFERSRGLAIETVDGGIIEDVVVSNLTMREITTAPIFLRLGNRARGPEGTTAGAIRRVKISHITAHDVDARYPILIVGLADHPIEDVTLTDIRVMSRGGVTMKQVADQPAEMVNTFFMRATEPGNIGPRDPFAVPEREKGYPEPSMFGLLPAGAVYARHVKNLEVRDLTISFAEADTRPRVVLQNVANVTFDNVRIDRPSDQPVFVLRNVREFEVHRTADIQNARHAVADDLSL